MKIGFTMRSFSMICAILVVLGLLASAQEPSPQARPRPVRPQLPGDFAPDPPPALNPSTSPARPFPAQPPPPSPGPTPAAAAVQEQPQPQQLPPPTPPQVTYRNGLLTVQAMNSTLISLLTTIRNKTGIQFEGLEGGAPERVAVSLGPAPEGEVLAAILGGSRFDYVVLDRADSPGIVQRVLLTPRGGTAPAANNAPAGTQPALNAEGDDEDTSDEPEQPQDTPLRPPLTQVQPQPQQPQQTGPKTPEQLYEELKRMQQLQQQQQQQQAPQNQAPKPPPIPQL